jgi:hypothetical protein
MSCRYTKRNTTKTDIREIVLINYYIPNSEITNPPRPEGMAILPEYIPVA